MRRQRRGKENTDVWTDWSRDGTQIRVPPHIKRHSKPHSRARGGKKEKQRRLATCLQRLFTTRKTREEKEKNIPRGRHFL